MKTFSVAVLAVAVLGFTASQAADDASAWVVPPAQAVDDRTQQMWSVRWWQWAASFGSAESPVADITGEKCAAGQQGEVFFLAGTYRPHPIQRECRVPAGKHLFFPLVNYVVMPDGGLGSGCESVVNTARHMTDAPLTLLAELDGNPLAQLRGHRQASEGCFNIAARRGGTRMNAASNGYWVMLKPLPKGRHRLRIGGQLPSLSQDVSYTLIVE